MELLFILGLVALGLACFTMEVITPSFGVLTGAGVLAQVWAIYQGFQISSVLGWLMIPGLLVGSIAYMAAMVRLLPDSKLAGNLILRASKHGAGEGTPRAGDYGKFVGKRGTAETLLRPSGTVRVEGRRLDAVAESGMIPRGTSVVVLRSRGSDVIVRREAEADDAGEPTRTAADATENEAGKAENSDSSEA